MLRIALITILSASCGALIPSTESSKTYNKVYFDIGVKTPATSHGGSTVLNVGRIFFNITPQNHPHYLPLHISNLCGLAAGKRKSVDPKATYVGCTFQFSPATIDDASFRYRWAHQCDGNQRNAIRASLASGVVSDWDEQFSDPERLKECTHNSFGGSYYGWRYEEILDLLSAEEGSDIPAILLLYLSQLLDRELKILYSTGERVAKRMGRKAAIEQCCCGFVKLYGGFGDDTNDGRVSLDVLRAMAKQKIGVPTILGCGVEENEE
jgi:hypothetical protein